MWINWSKSKLEHLHYLTSRYDSVGRIMRETSRIGLRVPTDITRHCCRLAPSLGFRPAANLTNKYRRSRIDLARRVAPSRNKGAGAGVTKKPNASARASELYRMRPSLTAAWRPLGRDDVTSPRRPRWENGFHSLRRWCPRMLPQSSARSAGSDGASTRTPFCALGHGLIVAF